MKLLKKLVLSALRISILLVLVNSCGTMLVPEEINPDVKKYVDIYKFEMGITDKNLEDTEIGFHSLRWVPNLNLKWFPTITTGNVIGMCLFLTDTIILDPNAWMRKTERAKTSLVFHELGHCHCNTLGHRKKLLEDKCPASLMHPQAVPDHCLRRHWSYYLKEFKENC